MRKLTADNFYIFAAHYYDNKSCLSQDEFIEDLRLMSTIKRSLARYKNGETVNIMLLVNLVVTFYNCFDHRAATTLLEYKTELDEQPILNAILTFLSLPTIINIQPDQNFLDTINQELNKI
jgi:hypothetical protein